MWLDSVDMLDKKRQRSHLRLWTVAAQARRQKCDAHGRWISVLWFIQWIQISYEIVFFISNYEVVKACLHLKSLNSCWLFPVIEAKTYFCVCVRTLICETWYLGDSPCPRVGGEVQQRATWRFKSAASEPRMTVCCSSPLLAVLLLHYDSCVRMTPTDASQKTHKPVFKYKFRWFRKTQLSKWHL